MTVEIEIDEMFRVGREVVAGLEAEKKRDPSLWHPGSQNPKRKAEPGPGLVWTEHVLGALRDWTNRLEALR